MANLANCLPAYQATKWDLGGLFVLCHLALLDKKQVLLVHYAKLNLYKQLQLNPWHRLVNLPPILSYLQLRMLLQKH